MNAPTSYNRLKDQKSAYLRQHQNQPIHWWAYGPEAVQRAQDENKPIFLSVGYSSCHWCHMMAADAFNDPEIADFLNQHFISIKVDREEHPDIDSYYQQACQLYTKNGGWPLSAFLLPNLKPFFVGTYFPSKTDDQSTGLLDLLNELHRAYNDEREQVETNANKVTELIAQGVIPPEKVDFQGHFPSPSAIAAAIDKFFDQDHGGYGEAPKFPHFSFYEWAIEQMLEGKMEQKFGEQIIMTIEKMLMGGLFDQARGGIHRYSTDKSWTVPHFEKMLYDQAGLLRLLSKASLVYPSPLVYDALINTLDYLEVEMFDEDKKIFFASQDADSEGVEGLFFTYTLEEFEDALNQVDDQEETLAKNREKVLTYFGITDKGNFSQSLNVPTLNYELRQEIFTQDGWNLVRKTRHALCEERKNRVPPATDNKGIASWNFMMVSALVDVLQYCQIDVIRRQASQLFNMALEGVYEQFIDRNNPNGMRLKHATTMPSTLPYLEDFVNFADMQLRVYEVTGNPTFKNNFSETLKFIQNEFIQEGRALTRAKFSQDFELYPNQTMSSFDASFRSSAALLVGLSRRAAVLLMDEELLTNIQELQEKLTHEVLKNPIPGGEALRALTYPDEAYRVIKLPKEWLKLDRFVNFLPYFLARFILDYTDETQEWQICSMKQCELKGVGLEEFIQVLAPKPPESDQASKE